MKEIGLDISEHYSKSTHDLPADYLNNLDYVITLCAEEVCPVIISKAKKLHWPFPDPASKDIPDDEQIKRFRIARDNIRTRLQQFKKEMS